MRNFLLGCCVGFMVGGIGATYALSGAQSTRPYSSQQLMGETNLYGAILGLQTEAAIRDLQAHQPDYSGLYGDRPCR
jgi:hypothetical protein